ncbi:SAM-dependent methyltransferase [Nonomuraea sp. NPDC046802]|uniref:SAM-dependent methyltransferase n=1 Tax=Nonomuraea sp. NPDC046802 TaxID=3154919 RepID=UPI0033F31857
MSRPAAHAHISPTDRTLNVSSPNAARIHHYLLGGRNHFASDRAAAENLLKVAPWMRDAVVDSRRFLERAVSYTVAELGISQFVDMGCGLPAQDNVHQIAQEADPAARVVYVDNNPLVGVHARATLDRNDARVSVVEHDVRDVDGLLADETLRSLISWTDPIVVCLTAVLDFVDKPAAIIDTLWKKLPQDSVVIFASLCSDGLNPSEIAQMRRVYTKADAGLYIRSGKAIRTLFDGRWDWQSPGLGPVRTWRPISDVQSQAIKAGFLGGVTSPLRRPI